MSKSFDEIMKVIEEEGGIPDEKAKAIITEHGQLSAAEKKQVASAIRMNKALKGKKDEGDSAESDDADEVSMEDYLQALGTLDSEDASAEEKKEAQAIIDKFEG
jgi:hypothetical protein